MIDRDLLKVLTQWNVSRDRKPLILRGARQVGKSYLVREFARRNFDNLCEINFELDSEVRKLFTQMDPLKIIPQLALYTNQSITPQKTLLFLDEIQDCPDAIVSLRYFYERMPNLSVIAAGSFLDMALNLNQELSFPVGRVEHAYLTPISFLEYLNYTGNQNYRELIGNLDLKTNLAEPIHNKLLELFGGFLIAGGMPAVVKDYVAAPAELRFKQIQSDILRSYQDDFRKYRSRINYEKLEQVFNLLAKIAGRRYKYSDVWPDGSSETAKKILSLFQQAKIITPVHATLANGLPLGSEVDEREHKLIFLDVGLLIALGGSANPAQNTWNLDLINSGALAEQVVGQELLAYCAISQLNNITGSLTNGPELYFWRRDKIHQSAEVDYLIVVDGQILPLEVKAGTTGKLKSLRGFLKARGAKFGVRVSQHPLSFIDGVLSVPFYGVSQIERLVRGV